MNDCIQWKLPKLHEAGFTPDCTVYFPPHTRYGHATRYLFERFSAWCWLRFNEDAIVGQGMV